MEENLECQNCGRIYAVPCRHLNYHHEDSLGLFCNDCGAPV
jgi:hypothetical protein